MEKQAEEVTAVRLLGSGVDVSWQMTSSGLQITPPTELGESQHAWSLEIVTDEEQHRPNVTVEDASEAMKNTGKVDLEGRAGKD